MSQQERESTAPAHGRGQRQASSVAPTRRVIGALLGTLAFGAALVAVVGGVRTASGRFAGTTRNEGSLLSAATIDLRVTAAIDGDDIASVEALALDAANLVPGDVVQRCMVVGYSGVVDDVDVRMTGRIDGGSGLDAHLDAEVDLGTGSDPACSDFARNRSSWAGTLDELAAQHGGFETGLELMTGADDGDSVTIRVRLALQDDDRAQGLDTGFWFELEVRP